MLDFFRNTFLELRGIDTNEIKKLEKSAREKEKAERIILSKKMKALLRIFNGIFLLWLGGAISMEVITGVSSRLLKYIFLSLLAISAVVLLCYKNKKAELAAVICTVIFLAVSFIFS